MSSSMESRAQQTVEQEPVSLTETASYMAKQVIEGFIAHDTGDREAAIDSFYQVDKRQFAHLEDDKALIAARAYVDALFEKDDLELQHLRNRDMDRDTLDKADWGPVREKFRVRAGAVGMNSEYAVATTEAWRKHKTGGDYWTPIQQAQVYELRAALQDPSYPQKPKFGSSGFGPEAARYSLAIELHDMHEPSYAEQAVEVMVPYYELILRSQDHDDI